MSIAALRDSLKDYAKDIRLNLGTVLTAEGAPGLSSSQLWGIALACAYSLREARLVDAVTASAGSEATPEVLEAAKAAATIMAMNNVYYRSLHLIEDAELSKMPAKLRMNVIGKPTVAKVDFELYSLAVSALSGCGMCLTAHTNEVRKAGITTEGVQSAIRIAAVLNASVQALSIG